MNERKLVNPILAGFYPDPSICRAGDDYYLVTSSFSFFPGVPIFHSKDLCNWESLGYVLDRPDQVRLSPSRLSGGIFAPTIRYHGGVFYVIVGNTSTGDNILVTTTNPAGDWSEAHHIAGVGGDPSLFWNDNGKCYCSYSSMGGGNHGIVHSEIDLEKFELVGEEIFLWGGAAVGSWSPEASHMYKIGEWYYIMIAEGGTEHYHATAIARSQNINGPYINYRGNPILTHGNLTQNYPICNVGHSDIVETQNGQWYLVALGSRIYGGYHKNMGRETFIAPVIWESGWPIVSPDTGKVEWEYDAPNLPEFPVAKLSETDNFDAPKLSWPWSFIGTPVNDVYRIADSKLFIKAVPESIQMVPTQRRGPGGGPGGPGGFDMEKMRAEMEKMRKAFVSSALGFVGRRQQHFSYEVIAKMHFEFKNDSETAGIVYLQNDYNQIRLEIAIKNGKQVARVIKHVHVTPSHLLGDILPALDIKEEHATTVVGEIEYNCADMILKHVANGQSNSYYIGVDMDHMIPVAENIDGSYLGSETAGGFIGAFVGMFASGNGADTGNEAAFDWFTYIPR